MCINHASYDDVLCDDVFCDIFDACFHLLMLVYLSDIHMLNLNPEMLWSPPACYHFYQDAYSVPS